jgi:hypothetical protein
MSKTYFIIPILFILSCKRGIEKIPLDNLKAHISFQDSIINESFDTSSLFSKIDSLAEMYQNLKLKEKENNPNYHYYLGRIYGKVDSISFYKYFYDSIRKKPINIEKYMKYKQASFSELKQAYLIGGIRLDVTSLLVDFLFSDELRYKKHRDSNIYLNYDPKGQLIIDYVVRNCREIFNTDTSIANLQSRNLLEKVYLIYDEKHFKNNYLFGPGDKEKQKQILEYAELSRTINNNVLTVIDKNKFENIHKKVLIAENKARLEIERQEKIAAKEAEAKKEIERKEKNFREYGNQYIGTWTSEQSRLTIYRNGKYSIRYFVVDAEGAGTWECTGSTISFSKTSGEHVAFMYESVYRNKVATLNYYNVFAPTLCLEGRDGHVDFCFDRTE